MSADLKPCPFCGAGTTLIQPTRIRIGDSYDVLSVAVEHWCKPMGGIRSSIVFKAKTRKEAIGLWNRREEENEQ